MMLSEDDEKTGFRDNRNVVGSHPNSNRPIQNMSIEAGYHDNYNDYDDYSDSNNYDHSGGDDNGDKRDEILQDAWEEYRVAVEILRMGGGNAQAYRAQQAGMGVGDVPYNWRQKRRMRYFYRCMLPVLAVVIFIAVMSNMRTIVDINSNENVNFDDMSGRVAQVASLVVQQGWSDPKEVAAMGTPQWQAAQWLGELDPFELDLDALQNFTASTIDEHINDDNDSDKEQVARLVEFQQRYVLAVIYYALNGANWVDELNFLSKESVCSWNKEWESTTEGLAPLLPVGADCLDDGNNHNHTQITQLWLPANNLLGSVPKEIGFLTALQELNLYGNHLTGTLPDSMSQLTQLRSVSLHNNTLTGPLPVSLLGDALPQLAALNLAHNQFSGGIPAKRLSKMTSLHTLNLGHNPALYVPDIKALAVSGLSVQFMPALRHLWLSGCQIHGTLGGNWVKTHWAALESIDLSGNSIKGSIPDTFFQLSSLTVLDLHGNGLTGKWPQLDMHNGGSQLKFLALQENSLTGAIPTRIGTFFRDQLTHLDLSKNKFSSTIPKEIYQLTNLVYLFLAFNDFEQGDIPDALAELTQLVDLSLKETNRRGTIPDVIGKHLSKLVLLDLDGNEMYGSIPSSLGDLGRLRFLFLSHNRLDGLIPASFGTLHKLETLLLQNNQLTGKTPAGLCPSSPGQKAVAGIANLDVFMADCVHIKDSPSKFNNQIADGEVECTCCTVCCEDSDTELEVCHTHSWYGELDPIWEYKYTRTVYLTHNGDLEFPASP
jgi:Leucine-rich repeat (LRR) protein